MIACRVFVAFSNRRGRGDRSGSGLRHDGGRGLSQAATMGVEDVLETVAPVPREELVVVTAASEAEETDADDLAD